MHRLLRALLACGALAYAGEDRPVLVELFTSEGCSSCPPADALLARLDHTSPVPGAHLIVMSEHVDYWNRIGWTDPYSSPLFSARQEGYVRRLQVNGPYTPQMVVDGRWEFVGSDARAAAEAIQLALAQPKVGVRITGDQVEVGPLPAGTAHKAGVFAAYASDSGTSDVLRGENGGMRLHHVSVVRELKQVGTVDGRSGFRMRAVSRPDLRLIVFVQEAGSGPVWGVAMRAAP